MEYLNIFKKCPIWNDGHDVYMVCGVNIEELLTFLHTRYDICHFSDAELSEDGASILFDGKGERFTLKPGNDVLKGISKKFPKARCYWVDEWDGVTSAAYYVDGKLVEVMPLIIDNFTKHKEGNDTYYEVVARLYDKESGLSIRTGGGSLTEADAQMVEKMSKRYNDLGI